MDLTIANELTKPYRIPRKKIEDMNGTPKREYKTSPFPVVETKKEVRPEPTPQRHSPSKSTLKRRHEERKGHGEKRGFTGNSLPGTSSHAHPGPSGVNTPDANVVDKIFGEMRTCKMQEKSMNSPITPRAEGEKALTRAELQRHTTDDKTCFDFMGREGLMERILGHKMLTGRVESHLNMGYIRVETSARDNRLVASSGFGGRNPLPHQSLVETTQRDKGRPRTPPVSPKPKQQRRGPKTPPGSPGPVTPPPEPPAMQTSSRIASLYKSSSNRIPPPPREHNTPSSHVSGGKSENDRILYDMMVATGVPVIQLQAMMDEEMKKTLNTVSQSVIMETIRNALRGINQQAPQPKDSRHDVSGSAHSVGMDVESGHSISPPPPPPPPIIGDQPIILQAPPPPPSLPPIGGSMMHPPPMHLSRMGSSNLVPMGPPSMQTPPTLTSLPPPPPILNHTPTFAPPPPPPQISMGMPPPLMNMSVPPPPQLLASGKCQLTNGVQPSSLNGTSNISGAGQYSKGPASFRSTVVNGNAFGQNTSYSIYNAISSGHQGTPTTSRQPPNSSNMISSFGSSSTNQSASNWNQTNSFAMGSNENSKRHSTPRFPASASTKNDQEQIQAMRRDGGSYSKRQTPGRGPFKTTPRTPMSASSMKAAPPSVNRTPSAVTPRTPMGRGGNRGKKSRNSNSTPLRAMPMIQPMQQNVQSTLLSALGLGGGGGGGTPNIPAQTPPVKAPLLDRYGQPLPVPDRLRSDPPETVPSLTGFGSGTTNAQNDFIGRGRNY